MATPSWQPPILGFDEISRNTRGDAVLYLPPISRSLELPQTGMPAEMDAQPHLFSEAATSILFREAQGKMPTTKLRGLALGPKMISGFETIKTPVIREFDRLKIDWSGNTVCTVKQPY